MLLVIPVTGMAQVDVIIPITITNSQGRVDVLNVRIHENAVDLITSLDPFDVATAPLPPGSQYDVRLRNPSLPSIEDATTDARKLPAIVSEEYKYNLLYQPGIGATGSTSLTLSWDPADITGVSQIEDMFLQDAITGTLIGPIDMSTTSTFTIDNQSPFWDIDLTMCMSFNNLFLPVELTSFGSRQEGTDLFLDWTTATETNNSGFEILHSSPFGSGTWSTLGFVEGNGTTTEENNYTFDVGQLEPGIHQFRLKQIDFDGKFEYSNIIETSVDLPNSHFLSSAYPNPFNPKTSFSLSVKESSQVTVVLYNGLGKAVKTIFEGRLNSGQSQSFTIDAGNLNSGMYLYRVQGTATSSSLQFDETKRVMLLK